MIIVVEKLAGKKHINIIGWDKEKLEFKKVPLLSP